MHDFKIFSRKFVSLTGLLLASSLFSVTTLAADYTNTTSGGYNTTNTWGVLTNPGNTNVADNVVITNGAVAIQFAYAASNDFINVNNLGLFTNATAFGLSGATISINSGGNLLIGNAANSLSGAVVRLNGGTLNFNTEAWNYGVSAGRLEVLGNSTIAGSNNNNTAGTIVNSSLDFPVAGNTLTLLGAITGGTGGFAYRFDSVMVSNNATVTFSKTGAGGPMTATFTNVTITSGSTLMVSNQTPGANTGTLTFLGNNSSLVGTVDVRAGVTVVANASNALGNATVTINDGGTFSIAAGYAAGRTNIINTGGILSVTVLNNALTNTLVQLNGGLLYFNSEPWNSATGPLGILQVWDDSTITNRNGNNSGGTIINESLDFTAANKTLTLAGSISANGAIGYRFNTVTVSNDATVVFSRTGAGAGQFTTTFSNIFLSADKTLSVTNRNTFNAGTLTFLGNNSNMIGTVDVRSGVTLVTSASNSLGTAAVAVNDGATLTPTVAFGLGSSTTTINSGGLLRVLNINNALAGAVIRLNGGTLFHNYIAENIAIVFGGDLQVAGDSTITNYTSSGSASGGGSFTYSSLDFMAGAPKLTLAADITGTSPGIRDVFNRVTVTNDATIVFARTGGLGNSLIAQLSNLTITAGTTLTLTNSTGALNTIVQVLGTNNFGVVGTNDVRSGITLQAAMSNSLGSGSIIVGNGATLTPTVAWGLGTSTSTINTGGWLAVDAVQGALSNATIQLNGGTLWQRGNIGSLSLTVVDGGAIRILSSSVISNFANAGNANSGGTFTHASLDFTAADTTLTLASIIDGTAGGIRYRFDSVTVTNNATVELARSGNAGFGLTVLFSNVTGVAGKTLSVTNSTGNNATLTFVGNNNTFNGGVEIRAGATVASAMSNALGSATVYVNGGTLQIANQDGLGAAAVVVSNGIAIGNVATVIYGGDGATERSSLVTGSGAVWTNIGTLIIGAGTGQSNKLTVANGGVLLASTALNVGGGAGGNNQLIVDGGTVWATTLRATNTGNQVILNSGTINSPSTFISNNVFTVGDGTGVGVFNTLGGTHNFGSGIIIASNSFLTGTGTILAGGPLGVTLTNGGILSAGLGTTGIGVLTANNLNWLSGGILQVDLQNFGVAGTDYDFLRLTGALTNSGAGLVVNLNTNGLGSAFNPATDYQLLIGSFNTQFGFSAGNFTVNNNFGASGWQVTQIGTNMYLTYFGTAAVTPDFVWGFGSGKWSDGPRWTNGVAPAADGLKLQFGTNTLTQFTATNTSISAVNALVLDGGASAPITNFLVGNALTITGDAAAIVQQNQGAFVISNALVLATNLTVRGNGLGTVTLASNITGTAGQFAKQGAFNLVLRGSNTFVAPVLMDSPGGGTLTLASLYALGANAITVSNGIVFASTAGTSYIVGNGWNDQTVLITGAASTWSNTAVFAIGTNAAVNNAVTIANNGSLFASAINIGNSTTATGNGLIISNGGTVRGGLITVGNNGSTGNYFNVLGGGIASNGAVTVGGNRSGFNRMTVTNATLLSGGAVIIGNGSSNNTAQVLSGGSWNMVGQTLTIGTGAAISNALVVNSGALTNVGATAIGATVGTAGNSLTISNGGLFRSTSVTVSGTNNFYNVGGVGSLSTVSNSTITLNGFGELMTVTNASLRSTVTIVGNGTSSNTVRVLAGSIWDLQGNALNLGGNFAGTGTGNVFVVDGGGIVNGAVVTNIGNTGGASGGAPLVIGGAGGSDFQSLIISNGGALAVTVVGNAVRLGEGRVGNRVIVDNGTFTSVDYLTVGGVGGSNNFLVVTNGGYVRLSTLNVGSLAGIGAASNTVIVAGANTGGAKAIIDLNGTGALQIGGTAVYATNNWVFIRQDGIITNAGGGVVIGNVASAANNGLVVTNGGALFSGAVTVGGSNNAYIIDGGSVGSVVSNGAVTINGNNFMTVTNATVQLGGNLVVGNGGSNAVVNINRDSLVNLQSNFLAIQGGTVTSNNSVTINAGTVTNAQFSMGATGNGVTMRNNSLIITNGGKLFSSGGTIAFNNSTAGAESSSNVVLVTGLGSSWNMNAGSLTIAWDNNAGSSNKLFYNTLRIDDGAVVTNFSTVSGSFMLGRTVGSTSSTKTYSNYLIIANGGQLWTAGNSYVGTTSGGTGTNLANGATVTTGGLWDLGGKVLIIGHTWSGGGYVASNFLSVTDGGVLNNGSLVIGGSGFGGSGAPVAWGNQFLISGASTVTVASLNIGYANIPAAQAIGNSATIGGAGAAPYFSNATITVGFGGPNAWSNSLTATNSTIIGGLVVGSGANSNSATIWSGVNWNALGNNVTVGSGAATGNTVTVNGSVFTNINSLTIGTAATSVNNQLVLTNGAQLFAASVSLGGAVATDNRALVLDGALLEANTLVTGAGAGNTLSNRNATYQFTLASPVITPNGADRIAITDGTISFRAISNADVTNNFGNGALKGITFAGVNTFQLNAASNTTAGQTYTFQQVAGNPSNYVNLAMVNGHTAYRGGNLTIGSTGSMLVSSTTATVTGLFTNQGQTRLVSSAAAFSSGVINAGVFSLQNSTLTGAFTNLATGTLQGDGVVVGEVVSFGTNSPGFSVGTLTITGNLTLASSAVTVMELTGGGTNDQFVVSGLMTYGGQLIVTNSTGFTFAAGQTFQLFDFGSQVGSFSLTNLPDLTAFSLTWDTTQLAAQGLLVVVPEPSTLLLLVLGGVGLAALMRRRARS
ncbi:MAG: hypothetical protein PCFJNLEI_00872 [Verrucomicrobiae bacterium]|nr:hypothetical protein [Verrucomicrobiae bacterium]